MVDQKAAMNRFRETTPSPVQGAITEFGSVLATTFDLAELQFRLAKADAEGAAHRIRKAFLASAAAAVFLLSALPLLGLATANLLSRISQLPIWASQFIVAGVFLSVVGGLLLWSWRMVGKAKGAFDRTGQAANLNLQWLREAVARIGQ